jgi:hypothetical protein
MNHQHPSHTPAGLSHTLRQKVQRRELSMAESGILGQTAN